MDIQDKQYDVMIATVTIYYPSKEFKTLKSTFWSRMVEGRLEASPYQNKKRIRLHVRKGQFCKRKGRAEKARPKI
jgi:hypothetical protein